MAGAGGAHLTGITEVARPSIFEIVSHEGFANALKPAVYHVVKVFAERSPGGRFGTAYRYFNEVYLTFDAVVQWHYILTRGATLSEAFYGLERQFTVPDNKLLRIRLSYVVSVIVPYISSKLDSWFENYHDSGEAELPQKSNSGSDTIRSLSLTRQFLRIYPYLKTLLKVVNLLHMLSYSFGYSDHHSLVFRILRMTLRYTSEERNKYIEAKNAELWISNEWRNPRKLPTLMLRSLGESALFAVEIGSFFMQFLEWWYNDDKRARISLASLPVPPAPQSFCEDDGYEAQNIMKLLPSDMDKCPICRKEFRNPTALSVSGVVYCYGCIFPLLQEESRCPLTKLPCNTNHLIRIYV